METPRMLLLLLLLKRANRAFREGVGNLSILQKTYGAPIPSKTASSLPHQSSSISGSRLSFLRCLMSSGNLGTDQERRTQRAGLYRRGREGIPGGGKGGTVTFPRPVRDDDNRLEKSPDCPATLESDARDTRSLR